jgi:hypothetical protein
MWIHQQLGEYKVNKRKVKLDNVNLLKAEYVVAYLNLFIFFSKKELRIYTINMINLTSVN